MSTTREPDEQDAQTALSTLPGALNIPEGLSLLDAQDAGYCSGGVCHIPAVEKP